MSLLPTMGLGQGGPLPDISPPIISNVSPTPGTTIASNEAVSLDVTDESGLALVMLVAHFPDGEAPEVIYDGTAFSAAYDGSSTKTAISGGFHFSILRDTGWRSAPTITPYIIDTSGNEAA